LRYGPTEIAKLAGLPGVFALGAAISTKSPALKATLEGLPDPVVEPRAIVHVTVVFAPFLRSVNVMLAVGAVWMKQVIPVK
jgi:hypothetical protein